jgi:hypothetical protein
MGAWQAPPRTHRVRRAHDGRALRASQVHEVPPALAAVFVLPQEERAKARDVLAEPFLPHADARAAVRRAAPLLTDLASADLHPWVGRHAPRVPFKSPCPCRTHSLRAHQGNDEAVRGARVVLNALSRKWVPGLRGLPRSPRITSRLAGVAASENASSSPAARPPMSNDGPARSKLAPQAGGPTDAQPGRLGRRLGGRPTRPLSLPGGIARPCTNFYASTPAVLVRPELPRASGSRAPDVSSLAGSR